jgi:hypothetical protein
LTNDATPAFSGMGEAGGALTVYNAAGAVVCTATVAPDGTWTCTPGAPLAEGIQIVTATITDAAGNDERLCIRYLHRGYRRSRSAGHHHSHQRHIDQRRDAGVQWDGEAGGALTAFDAAGAVVCTATVAPDGTWTCTPDVPLAEGVQTITATVTDARATKAIRRPLPSLWTPTFLRRRSSPPPGNGALTNNATPAFSGMGEAGGRV